MNIWKQLLCRLGIGGARRERVQLAQSLERMAAKSDEKLLAAERKNEVQGDFLTQWLRNAQNRTAGGRCDDLA